jgi:hypothetical protein
MPSLGNDYCDVKVEYDIIDGDDSVGLPVSFEFDVSFINEQGETVDIGDSLTPEEFDEVIDAIEKDFELNLNAY